jgi:hypothetical protein
VQSVHLHAVAQHATAHEREAGVAQPAPRQPSEAIERPHTSKHDQAGTKASRQARTRTHEHTHTHEQAWLGMHDMTRQTRHARRHRGRNNTHTHTPTHPHTHTPTHTSHAVATYPRTSVARMSGLLNTYVDAKLAVSFRTSAEKICDTVLRSSKFTKPTEFSRSFSRLLLCRKRDSSAAVAGLGSFSPCSPHRRDSLVCRHPARACTRRIRSAPRTSPMSMTFIAERRSSRSFSACTGDGEHTSVKSGRRAGTARGAAGRSGAAGARSTHLLLRVLVRRRLEHVQLLADEAHELLRRLASEKVHASNTRARRCRPARAMKLDVQVLGCSNHGGTPAVVIITEQSRCVSPLPLAVRRHASSPRVARLCYGRAVAGVRLEPPCLLSLLRAVPPLRCER